MKRNPAQLKSRFRNLSKILRIKVLKSVTTHKHSNHASALTVKYNSQILDNDQQRNQCLFKKCENHLKKREF